MNFRAILSSFCFTPQANTFLSLTCRPVGPLSWPLSKLRLADTGTLTINQECLDYCTSSLKSFSSCAIPLANITSVSCGSGKPWSYIVGAAALVLLALFCLLGQQPILAAACLLLAAFTALQYYTRQHIFIRIEHGDDNVFCITLNPGLIEGIVLPTQEVEAACALMRAAMLQSRKPAL